MSLFHLRVETSTWFLREREEKKGGAEKKEKVKMEGETEVQRKKKGFRGTFCSYLHPSRYTSENFKVFFPFLKIIPPKN